MAQNIEKFVFSYSNETVNAGARTGDMIVVGGGGYDYLETGAGTDTLIGGDWTDTSMKGGSGSDTFVLSGVEARYRVLDFQVGIDHVQLARPADGSAPSMDYIRAHATQTGDSTFISIGGASMLLQTVGLSSLTLNDFIFV
jgi:Ca2+-binding RTX toxin-like protein